MADILRLNNIQIKAKHGYYQAEKDLGQLFEVDIVLHVDFTKALKSDELEDTVDFEAVYKDVNKIFSRHNHYLVEYVGGQIIDHIFKNYPLVEMVTVKIRKPHIPIDGILDNAEIEITRSR